MDVLTTWAPDIIGCLGTLIILVSYALLQARRLEADSILYSLLNIGGALMILVSLFYVWNMAAVVMEVAWLTISLYGLIKGIFTCRHHHRTANTTK